MKRFKKILIANRGEIAVRVIQACKELGMNTVAVYSDVERDAMHVRMADNAVCIGPASPRQSYLNIPALLTAAELTDSQAIHPGYGFLSENAHFAETCAAAGIAFVGPTPENIRTGGDKSKARAIMKKKGVPVVPGSKGVLSSEGEALKLAREIGFPVMLKASQGGGGRGMKVVMGEGEFSGAFNLAQREAHTAFGSRDLYLEKFIEDFRHIEVQIVADNMGNIVHLGERDCSIQRRHQKLIEESPSPMCDEKLRKKVGDLAVKAAKAIDYRNVGTVEFAVEPDGNVYFIEMNTRVQVEHPVTEMVTGIDLIKEQIRLAEGEALGYGQTQVKTVGHAMECRINAEDPERFIPSPGTISFFYPPGGPGVRVDTAAFSGAVIPSHYDSLIAKVIVQGRDRNEAIMRMRRALSELIVEGVKTTRDFHQKVLEDEDFQSGNFNTGFIGRKNHTLDSQEGGQSDDFGEP
jgi:acetyl-CoA carboxylase biotin carboxylase subunit